MKTSEPKTLSQEFDRYIAACYPLGVFRDQERQLKDAFIAGAWLALDAFTNEMGEEETIDLCERWIREAKLHVVSRAVRKP